MNYCTVCNLRSTYTYYVFVQCISVNNRGNAMKSLYYGDQARFTGQERERKDRPVVVAQRPNS